MQLTALVTSGPLREPIDPIRYITNYSSGKQGAAIAQKLLEANVSVKFITGPSQAPPPTTSNIINVQTTEEMLNATVSALPVDIAILVAAVPNWRLKHYSQNKIKSDSQEEISLELIKNPDIAKIVCHHALRPKLVICFSIETENFIENNRAKLQQKGCDFLVANHPNDKKMAFNQDYSTVTIFEKDKETTLQRLHKTDIAEYIVQKTVNNLKHNYST